MSNWKDTTIPSEQRASNYLASFEGLESSVEVRRLIFDLGTDILKMKAHHESEPEAPQGQNYDLNREVARLHKQAHKLQAQLKARTEDLARLQTKRDHRIDILNKALDESRAEVKRLRESAGGDLEEAIKHAINCHNNENDSDTPDFILTEFLMTALAAYHSATRKRTEWYGGR